MLLQSSDPAKQEWIRAIESVFHRPAVFVVLAVAIVLGVILRRHASREQEREAPQNLSDAHNHEWLFDGLTLLYIVAVSILAGSILLYFFPSIGR
jgi:hypothetical protein